MASREIIPRSLPVVLTAVIAFAFTTPSPSQRRAVTSPPSRIVVDVLAGNGLAWQIRPSLLTGGNGWEAGALAGVLENAAGNPADIVRGDSTPLGFSSYGKLSVEVVSGGQGVFPYAPTGPAEYDPLRREVVFPAMVAAGLRVSRTVRVSGDGTACAWLNQFINETSQPMTVWATITSDLDPLAPAEWVLTSNGDAVPDLKDEWLVSQSPGGGKVVGHIIGRSAAAAFLVDVRTSPVSIAAKASSGGGTLALTYQLRLEPGDSSLLLHIAFLSESTQEAASQSDLDGSGLSQKLRLSPREQSGVLNFDGRRLACCGCDFPTPWFREPERGTVVKGSVPSRIRAYYGSGWYPKVLGLDTYGRYKGVDASGSVVVWQGPLLDQCSFRPEDAFPDEDRDPIVERSAILDVSRAAGGFSNERRLEAVLWSDCAYSPWMPVIGTMGAAVPLIDGNPCQTHVDIISPNTGTLLDRPVNLAIQPYSPSTASLECFVDGSVLFTQTVQTPAGRLAPPRVSYLLDPATIKAGSRTLTAKMVDSAGCSESKSITVVIPNQPPTLDVTTPNDNAVVGGLVAIEFRATDDRRLDHIEVFVDGVPVARADLSGSAVSSSLEWDSCGGANGRHSVRVVLTDGDGATAERSMTVDVRNVQIDLSADRKEAFQRSLVELRFAYQNPGPTAIGTFAVWRKVESGEFIRVSAIPLASAPAGTGTWLDMPGKAGSFTYKIEALDAAGRIIGRSQEARL